MAAVRKQTVQRKQNTLQLFHFVQRPEVMSHKETHILNLDATCEIFHSSRTPALLLLLKGDKGNSNTMFLLRKSKATVNLIISEELF